MTPAVSTLHLVSEYLGDKDYLLGDEVCSLDALLFAVLAPVWKFPFSGSKLQNELRACANVVQYLQRILKNYFKEEMSATTTGTADDLNATSVGSDARDSEENADMAYDVLVPISVAAIVMFS